MAGNGLKLCFGLQFLIYFNLVPVLGTSRYCDIAYECYKHCYLQSIYYTSCGLFGLFDCTRYVSRSYMCKTVCHKQDCCNGFTGTNCNIPSPCEEAIPLPDIERRARNYKANGEIGNDPYVDDEYTGPGWFSVRDYKMPDSNYKPKHSFCGTKQPIYIKGTHPDVTTLTNDSLVAFDVCALSTTEDCVDILTIEVRKCDNALQYYLHRTSQQSAYCMDPPAIQNVRDFEDAPTDVQIGILTVEPKLMFRKDGGYELPYLDFLCRETQSKKRKELLYSSYWFVDSVLFKAFERETGFVSLSENDLIEHGHGLGITIQCGISASTSVTGLQTKMTTSKPFYAGIEVDPLVISMKKDATATITLRPTVPFGCYAKVGEKPTARCIHNINMYYPDLSYEQCEVHYTYIGSLPRVNTAQEICGVEIKGFYPYEARASSSLSIKSATLNITSPYLSDSDPTGYKLGLKTKNGGTHKIWKNALLPEVQLKITTNTHNKKKLCYAHVDPHMQTTDGRAYEHNEIGGKYILYRHMDNGIEVQIRTTKCNHNRAYCVCAVAVRAGGDVFLVNLCGGLRFIDMTSCLDGGALVIQKYSELNYQVQTNIGTLVKINILSGKYANLMNVDIHMAPKDYNRIRGLCGTFDGNTKNDFHDRNGKAVGRKAFIDAWKLGVGDVNMLEPSCSVDVDTWQDEGQLLYCTCNCYGDLKRKCGAPEETVTCSPSQYVNCSVNLSKSSELCQDYEDRCNVQSVGKRSSFYVNPEIEMKRRAALAELPHRFKRQSDGSTHITKDMAWKICRDDITTNTVTQHGHLLGGFNISQATEECTWDVYVGQDSGWAETHKLAADAAIEIGFKRDANYTLSHTDDLEDFKMQSCPYNCNGNGVCLVNGTCSCQNPYFGPDCGNDKSHGPVIEDLEGGGFCDQRYGSECKCFSVQVEALHETFSCQMIRKRKLLSGEIQNVGSASTTGRYRNLYNGECCFADGRRKRSLETGVEGDVLHYLYDVSLSNDGLKFGPPSVVYVYDSLCLNANTTNADNVTFTPKQRTCLINGDCYEENGIDFSSDCNKCVPDKGQFNWTEVCVSTSSTDGLSVGAIVGIVVGALVLVALIVTVVVRCLKTHNVKRQVQALQEFTVIRDQSKPVFNVQNLTYDL